MGKIWQVMCQRKQLNSIEPHESKLPKILSIFDLLAIGAAGTLGVGIYVTTGQVAKDQAGPAVTISYLITAIPCICIGFCFAELGVRMPRSGSVYTYSYTCIGELMGFLVGWTMIAHHCIGAAIVSWSLSKYINVLVNGTSESTSLFSHPHFDVVAFGIAVLLSIALAFGFKESAWMCRIVTFLDISVIIFTIGIGGSLADFKNWQLPGNATAEIGDGGFIPFGIGGIFRGIPLALTGFIGFESLTTTGEEVKNPQKSMPIAIITTLFLTFLSYFGISSVLTLMLPYYMIDQASAVPHALLVVGYPISAKIVTLAGISALLASFYGITLPVPRIMYAMASDGLLFKFLATINERFKTPVTATLLTGLVTGLMGAVCNLTVLLKLICISEMFCYSTVAVCVLLYRYRINDERTISIEKCATWAVLLKHCFRSTNAQISPNILTKLLYFKICAFYILSFWLTLCVKYLGEKILQGNALAIAATTIALLFLLIVYASLHAQSSNDDSVSFKVPFVPFMPAVSIFFCIYVTVTTEEFIWIEYSGLLLCGVVFYLFYGLRNSLKTLNYQEL